MSVRTAHLRADSLLDAVTDVAWRQWRAIGGAAAGGPARTQVDPEVLCLVSLTLESSEPRLWVAMTDWLRLGASLVSVQRLRNLSQQFPEAPRQLPRLAAAVVEQARDGRWRALMAKRARDRTVEQRVRQRSAGPALTLGPALMLRLRAAFSVGVKADLLAFLLGQPYRTSLAAATAGLGYSTPTVFRALQDLHSAAFVQAAELPTATEYWVDTAQWHSVLGGQSALPRWGFWRELLAYACAAVQLMKDSERRSLTHYATGVRIRDLATQHQAGLARAGVLDPGSQLPRSPELAEWRQFHRKLADRIAAG
jgi:hypothetical protein